MFEYEFLPSHIEWFNRVLTRDRPESLRSISRCLHEQAEFWPGQSAFMDIMDDEYEPLYNLIKDEPIFAELARELEIEMAS